VFKTDIDRVLPMQDVDEAIRLATTQGHQGKVLLAFNEPAATQ
jgi:NADPH:quinone reductase-like Zn-dependent oxidoreductase